MSERLIANAERFASVEVAGEIFLLDHQTGDSFRIGGSGAALWNLLLEGTSLDDAATRVAADTGGPIDQVRADTAAFVTQLRDVGAIHDGSPEDHDGSLGVGS